MAAMLHNEGRQQTRSRYSIADIFGRENLRPRLQLGNIEAVCWAQLKRNGQLFDNTCLVQVSEGYRFSFEQQAARGDNMPLHQRTKPLDDMRLQKRQANIFIDMNGSVQATSAARSMSVGSDYLTQNGQSVAVYVGLPHRYFHILQFRGTVWDGRSFFEFQNNNQNTRGHRT